MSNNPNSDKLDSLGFITHNPEEPLYKYTSLSTFKEVLKNNTLRFSNPAILNDPFEFSDDCFSYDLEEENFRKLLNDSFTENEKKEFNRDNSFNNFSKETFVKTYKYRTDYDKATALVFCTSLSPLIPLMWAHYSEHHKGVCFGIKLPTDLRNDTEMVITRGVRYNPIIETHSIFTRDDREIMLLAYNWVYSKSNVWDYEKEMRTYRRKRGPIPLNKDFVVDRNEDYKDLPFDKDSLVEIYYGLHTTQKDIQEIEELIKSNGYNKLLKRFKIEKIKGTYNLERKQFP